jgi:tetratricopeptide (TPR) repeat protein
MKKSMFLKVRRKDTSMTRFLNREQKAFRSVAVVLIYYTMLFPKFYTIDVGATDLATRSVNQSQLSSQSTSEPFRTAQVLILETLEETTSPDDGTAKLSEKEKKKLVEKGVAQYQEGKRSQAKKTLQQAKAVFPSNYAVPYYLGLIYLEEGRRSDAIAEWQQYALMDPKSEDSYKIRKYLTLLNREEAVEYAKQVVANEAAILRVPVSNNTVIVNTFKNLGSDKFDPLGKGMAALLIYDLSQVPDLQVVDRVKILALLQEMNLGTSGLVDQRAVPILGKLMRARYVTTGNLANIDEENMQIASALIDAEQIDSVRIQEAQGALKRFYDLEKEIACKIIEDLGYNCDKLPGVFDKIHTKSLAALTSFSVGLDYLDQEKYDEARKAFQKALDEDPEFDLAEQTLMATPGSALRLMAKSEMISTLWASDLSSTTLSSASVGTAVADDDDGVGFLGITTAVVAGAAAVVGLAAAGGGGGDDNSPARSAEPLSEQNLTGDWVGTWSDSSGTNNGNISLNLEQNSPSVTGTVSVTGSNCISTGSLSGTLTGNNLVSVIQTGSNTVSLNANLFSTSLNGTLEFTSGNCARTLWNFTASKPVSAIIRW